MRINFGATYNEVDQLLRASLKPTDKTTEAAFEASLGSLLSKPVETPKENPSAVIEQTLPTISQTPMEEVRASYRFEDPTLVMPDAAPLTPREPEAIPSKPEGMSVKTPTLISARLIALRPEKQMDPLQSVLTPEDAPAAKELEALQSLMPKGASSQPPVSDMTPNPNSAQGSDVSFMMPPQLGQKEILSRLSAVSEKVGLDPALTMAVVNAESGFNIRAVSSDGHNSKGLFQLLDSTGKDLLSRANKSEQEYDPFNPDLNMELGTSYLRYLHDIFRKPTQLPNSLTTKSAADDRSLEQLAVAAFNAGEGRVASAQLRTERAGKDPAHYDNVAPFLPSSTREYVARVVRGKRLF